MAVTEEKWQPARLLPNYGNRRLRRAGSDAGCSAFLAVLQSVREFGRALTMRCGAPAGSLRPSSRCRSCSDGSGYRPDGLISSYPRQDFVDSARGGRARSK